MAKPTVRYPASINLRITADTKDKIARIADRRRVDEATVARWWLDELPDDYVPGEGRWTRDKKADKGKEKSPISTGVESVDAVLGGGLLPGKVVLFDAPPSVSMTSLLIEIARGAMDEDKKVIFASGEMSKDDVAARASEANVWRAGFATVASATGLDVEEILSASGHEDVILVDGIEMIRALDVDAEPGSEKMRDAVVGALSVSAESRGHAVVIVSRTNIDLTAKMRRLLWSHLHLESVEKDGTDTGVRRIRVDEYFGKRSTEPRYVSVAADGAIVTPSIRALHRAGIVSLLSAPMRAPRERVSIGVAEFDEILGGGLVLGNTVLLGGPPGVGRTTAALQMVAGFVASGRRAVFACGEMTERAVREYMARLGVPEDDVRVIHDASGLDMADVTDKVLAAKAKLLVVDTVQVALLSDVRGENGQPTMLDAITNWVTSFAQAKDVAVILVCHDNRDGNFAGTEKMKHLVDVLVRVEPVYVADRAGNYADSKLRKVYVDGKTRQGAADVVKYVEMTESGFKAPDFATLHRAGLLV